MNIRRFRVLHDTGSSYAEIGRERGVDPRTVKKYLAADADLAPPRAPSRAGCQVEARDSGETPADRRRRQALLFHPAQVELQMRAFGQQRFDVASAHQRRK